MDVQAVLRPLSLFERSISELYLGLSERYRGDEEAASVFFRLALEEQTHVSLIEYQRRLARWNPDLFGEVEVDLSEILETTSRVQQLRDASTAPTLAEAVKIALELESGAAEYHARNAVAQANPTIAQLLGSLSSGDRLHISSLRSFAERRALLAAGDDSATAEASGWEERQGAREKLA
jgi:rubrerythrin